MELTLINVPQSTIDAIRNHKSKVGHTLDPEELTRVACEAIEYLLGSGDPVNHVDDSFTPESLIKGDTHFPLTVRESTTRLLAGYSSIAGADKNAVANEITDLVSDEIEKILKGKIASHLGLQVPSSAPPITRPQPQPNFTDTTGISTGLGDEDLEAEEILGLEDANAGVPSEGGLSEQDLDADMNLEHPEVESKGVAQGDMSEGQFMEAVTTDAPPSKRNKEVVFVDQRVAKRQKGPSKSKGKVIGMTNAAEADTSSF